jgi:hypothetical protein
VAVLNSPGQIADACLDIFRPDFIYGTLPAAYLGISAGQKWVSTFDTWCILILA